VPLVQQGDGLVDGVHAARDLEIGRTGQRELRPQQAGARPLDQLRGALLVRQADEACGLRRRHITHGDLLPFV
jgi:hypothetical protein